MSSNLSKQAMLVSVTIINGGLLGERRDNTASALVENTYGVAHRRAKASKYLIDRKHKAVRQVVAASQRVREIVYRYTMPWGDEKLRLLPVKTADEFRSKVTVAMDELEAARAEYIQEYPALVAASERDLGELFDRSQYPGVDRIQELFTAKVGYWPIPESNHFIAEISNEAAKEAKENIEREIEERLLEATYDMVRRAKEVVEAYIEKLENTRVGDDGKPQGVIRDSLTDNLKDTANLIERMNLTENPQINKVALDLKRLADLNSASYLRSTRFFSDMKDQSLTKAKHIMVNLQMLDLKDQEVAAMVADGGEYMD